VYRNEKPGGPLVARWTIYGSHTLSEGPSIAAKIATDGAGKHLQQGTNCNMTGHAKILEAIFGSIPTIKNI